jgi:tRNA A-37 threonylcarbamoyl transferase component Bud32
MTEADFDRIAASVAASRDRVAYADTSVGPVVVKRQRGTRSHWRGRAVNLLARALGVAPLQAVPAHGGARGQATEVERLRSLRGAGIRVPEVLHVEREFIVMRKLAGTNLVHLIERGGSEGFAAWTRGLDAIADAHARGGYLSHAFARNFIATDSGIAMIDFEDDALEVMSLAEAQSRDWIAYLHSTLWILERPLEEARAALAQRLAGEAAAVRELFERAGRRLAVLRRLPGGRRPWGREVAGARALAHVFPLLLPATGAPT